MVNLKRSGYKVQVPHHHHTAVSPLHLGFQERVLPGNCKWRREEAVAQLGQRGEGTEEKVGLGCRSPKKTSHTHLQVCTKRGPTAAVEAKIQTLSPIPPPTLLMPLTPLPQSNLAFSQMGKLGSSPRPPRELTIITSFSLPNNPHQRSRVCSSTHPHGSADVVHLVGDLLEEWVAGLTEAHRPGAAY